MSTIEKMFQQMAEECGRRTAKHSMQSKERARTWLSVLTERLRAELADVCAKWTFALTDDVARPHEALYRAEAAKLRWRIDRIWEAQQRLATLPYDRLPTDFAAAFSVDAADAWWTARETPSIRLGDGAIWGYMTRLGAEQ